jgi:hypothetical protein
MERVKHPLYARNKRPEIHFDGDSRTGPSTWRTTRRANNSPDSPAGLRKTNFFPISLDAVSFIDHVAALHQQVCALPGYCNPEAIVIRVERVFEVRMVLSAIQFSMNERCHASVYFNNAKARPSRISAARSSIQPC